MIEYAEVTLSDINELADMYVQTFNSEPWNDKWTVETASKRLHQMINVEDFYGLMAHEDGKLCGMIIGSMEQYFDCKMYNAKEFCVANGQRGHGIGGMILEELHKRLKQVGVGRVILFTSRGDYTQHFYSKHNYTEFEDMVMMGRDVL